MCSRYALEVTSEGLLQVNPEITIAEGWSTHLKEIRPTNKAPIIYQPIGYGGPVCKMLSWGLIPPSSKDPKHFYINARSDTLFELPSFASAARNYSSRCLIPAIGFWEWDDRKVRYLIRPKDGGLWYFAGLTEVWVGQGETRHTFTMVTTEANKTIEPIHDRMPVLLGPKGRDAWMNKFSKVEELQSYLIPSAAKHIVVEERPTGPVQELLL